MLIFKTTKEVPVFTGLNLDKTAHFKMSIFKDESKKIPIDFYVIPNNKTIEINFQFGDIGIEALVSFDNKLESDVMFVITWKELTLKASELLGFDPNDQEAYDNWIESSWNNQVYQSFKDYIFNEFANA